MSFIKKESISLTAVTKTKIQLNQNKTYKVDFKKLEGEISELEAGFLGGGHYRYNTMLSNFDHIILYQYEDGTISFNFYGDNVNINDSEFKNTINIDYNLLKYSSVCYFIAPYIDFYEDDKLIEIEWEDCFIFDEYEEEFENVLFKIQVK
jgi:hypothetical protein